MTQEQKQLLIRDLCARLPYGVKVCVRFNTGSRYTANVTAIAVDRDYIETRQNVLHPYRGLSVEDVRPYLRPMSSMTEEEEKTFRAFLDFQAEYVSDADLDNKTDMFDWLLAHHFDFRGLIFKGLALEAPEGMYKNE